MSSSKNLESLIWDKEKKTLQVLDQLLLPHQKVYLDVPDVQMAYDVIKSMQIRGRHE